MSLASSLLSLRELVDMVVLNKFCSLTYHPKAKVVPVADGQKSNNVI